ncbi:hypothetical protein [Pseudoalteromonas sp. H105]|uniref:hypothetical protein n=1 Tax=Pseudoalteromonas sp. H105 TaxID=1348393 RepID=UPI00073206D1|nr:hypothetical protein [Pseudoalteromonas sp. H105]KTF16956.1 hypothetical protein ATS75_05810 [Pseudoalteromonas sp. H105]
MTLFLRFFFLTLLTCSFNTTAKYNEAMCILYKQQMQQFSDDKSSRSYRNARRDFNKNCNNPPPVEKKPQQTITEPAPVINSQSTQQDNDARNDPKSVNEQSAVENTLSINESVNPLDANDTPKQSEVELSESDLEKTNTVVNQNPLIEAENETKIESNVQVTPVESQPKPALKVAKVPTITSPVIAASGQSTSLTTPILIIVLVLLIAGLVIYKLRIKKQSAESSTTPISNAVVTPVTMPTKQDVQQTSVSDSKAGMGTLHTDTAAPEKELPIEQDINEPNVHTVNPEVANTPSVDSPEQLEANTAGDELNEHKEREIEPIEPDATYDEPNHETADESLSTLLKNEHDFKEPEIRIFDPDAPLPGKKEELPPQARVEETPIDTLKEDSLADLADTTTDPLSERSNNQGALKQQMSEQTIDPADKSEQQQNISTEEHEIELALNTLNTQITEQGSSSERVDETSDKQVKANPFANLSLDPTWDPSTKEKPTIEPKKTVPKSAELIAAEERAKQLKTDK